MDLGIGSLLLIVFVLTAIVNFRELLEILSQQTKIECLENLKVLKELAKGYKD